jgi:flagellar motor switch/type III secretory pathway protein FliN
LPLAGFETSPAVQRSKSQAGGAPARAAQAAAGPPGVEGLLHEVALDLRVELGSAEITLRRLGELQPGDLIQLQPSDPEGYLVRIEGQPKFTATPGSVGNRLAVQILERNRRRGGRR